jgi:hypothetical protein
MRAHHRLVLAAATVLTVACSAPSQLTLAARVTEFGLYSQGIETVRPEPTAPSGQARRSSGFRLLQTTRTVPLTLGTRFGFCYEVSGLSPGSRPDVRVDTEHPTFARPGQPPVANHTVRRMLVARGGVIDDCGGYGFDHLYELVPGVWRFTVRVAGIPVLTQEFVAQ